MSLLTIFLAVLQSGTPNLGDTVLTRKYSLTEINLERIRVESNTLKVLAVWGGANLAGGLVLQSATNGVSKNFHQMNAGWGAINLALAIPGLVRLRKETPDALNLAESINHVNRLQKILLFNSGLDVAYMVAGGLLLERSNRYEGSKQDRYKGWGRSILLQGAALLLYDLAFTYRLGKTNKKLKVLIN